MDVLHELQQKTDRSVSAVAVHGVEIKRVFLRTGQKLFRRGVLMYLADKIVARLEVALRSDRCQVDDVLGSAPDAVYSEAWVDVGGQLMPAARLEKLVADIEQGTVGDLTTFQTQLDRIHAHYAEDEWAWVKAAYLRLTGVNLEKATATELADVADSLLVNRKEFLEAVLVDAIKEFDDLSAMGFGTDGTAEVQRLDFQAVRGDYDSNKFVVQLRAEIQTLTQRVAIFKQRTLSHVTRSTNMSDIADRIKKVTAETLKVDLSRVTHDARFVEDLGASSMESVELVAAFEEEFDINMDEQAALAVKKVGDAVKFVEKIVQG